MPLDAPGENDVVIWKLGPQDYDVRTGVLRCRAENWNEALAHAERLAALDAGEVWIQDGVGPPRRVARP
jgi:hypothetical protein